MSTYRRILLIAVTLLLLVNPSHQDSSQCRSCYHLSVPENQAFHLDCSYRPSNEYPATCRIWTAKFGVNPDGSGVSTDVLNIMRCKCHCRFSCNIDVALTNFEDPQHGTAKHLFVKWSREIYPALPVLTEECETQRKNSCEAAGMRYVTLSTIQDAGFFE